MDDVDEDDDADDADDVDEADDEEAELTQGSLESDPDSAAAAADAVSATVSASCQWHASADQPATSGNCSADVRHGATAAEVRRRSGGSGSGNSNRAGAEEFRGNMWW